MQHLDLELRSFLHRLLVITVTELHWIAMEEYEVYPRGSQQMDFPKHREHSSHKTLLPTASEFKRRLKTKCLGKPVWGHS